MERSVRSNRECFNDTTSYRIGTKDYTVEKALIVVDNLIGNLRVAELDDEHSCWHMTNPSLEHFDRTVERNVIDDVVDHSS